MKVIGSKTSFQNHQPSKLHFVSGADEKRKFSRPAVGYGMVGYGTVGYGTVRP